MPHLHTSVLWSRGEATHLIEQWAERVVMRRLKIFTPAEVKALEDYRIWIRFADGAEGEVDLSDLAGRGVFSLWQDDAAFQRVHIGPHGEIAWSEEVDLCPDSIYLRLTGKTPVEVFPNLRAEVGA